MSKNLIISGSLSLAAVLVFGALVVFPSYKSSSSRLYPTPFGYPAMLRHLGEPIPVDIGKTEPSQLSQIMMGEGFISPLQLVSISTRSPNLVSKVLVDVGANVNSRQLLIELDPAYAVNSVNMAQATLRIAQINLAKLKSGSRPEVVREEEADLDKAKGDLQTSKEQLDREKRLFAQGAVPRDELETYESNYRASAASYTSALENANMAKFSTSDDIRQAEAKVDSARADLDARRKDLQETKIYAPSDGVVIARDINPGEVTRGDGQQLLAVAHGIEFQAMLDQSYFANVHVGQQADVYLDAYPQQDFHGTIVKINPSVQGASQRAGVPNQQAPTFSAWVEITQLPKGVSLAQGMQGYARISASHEALAVPAGSIISFSGGEGLVLVVHKSKLQVQPVRFGATSDKMTEIYDGLAPGDVVVTSGQDALEPGDHVTYREHAST